MENHICIHHQNENTKEFKLLPGFTKLKRHTNKRIYWHLENVTPDMDKYKVILAFERAFQKWQPHVGSTVLESTSKPSQAHIIIRFSNNGDNDLPFRFSPRTLAYATSRGRVFVNEALNWGEMHSSTHYNLFKVIVHEIGHLLRVDHNKIPGAIMQAIYSKNDSVIISPDTQAAIRFDNPDWFDKQTEEEKEDPIIDSPKSDQYLEALKTIFKDDKDRMLEKTLLQIGELFGLKTNKDLKRIQNYNLIKKHILKL